MATITARHAGVLLLGSGSHRSQRSSGMPSPMGCGCEGPSQWQTWRPQALLAPTAANRQPMNLPSQPKSHPRNIFLRNPRSKSRGQPHVPGASGTGSRVSSQALNNSGGETRSHASPRAQGDGNARPPSRSTPQHSQKHRQHHQEQQQHQQVRQRQHPQGSRTRAIPIDTTAEVSKRSKTAVVIRDDDVAVPATSFSPNGMRAADARDAAAGSVRDEEGRQAAGAAAAAPPERRWFQVPNDLPERYWVVAKTSLAFVLANMDKVNMSVAIIPMANQFAWSGSTAGLVQSSFFWGYALSLVPSGWLAMRFTGQRMLRAGVLVWSLGTAAIPSGATSLPLLLAARMLVGFGEGVAPPAATDLVARLMPKEERSRAVAAIFNGFNVGSILGLMVAPFLIEAYGWESVFYLFGSAGIVWALTYDSSSPSPSSHEASAVTIATSTSTSTFTSIASHSLPTSSLTQSPASHHLPSSIQKEIVSASSSSAETNRSSDRGSSSHSNNSSSNSSNSSSSSSSDIDDRVPWGTMIRSPAVWPLLYVHFCQNWGHFCLLSWLPSYYSHDLHLNLSNSALVSMVPPLLSMLVSGAAAPIADSFIQKGTDVTLVRKVTQGTAFMAPAICMALTVMGPSLGLDTTAIVILLSAGLGLSACSYAGLYCAHQDISPKHASILLGLSTTVGSIPGIVGVPLTGYLFDLSQSWTAALFLPSILFYVTGTVVWGLFGDCSPRDFTALRDSSQPSKA